MNRHGPAGKPAKGRHEPGEPSVRDLEQNQTCHGTHGCSQAEREEFGPAPDLFGGCASLAKRLDAESRKGGQHLPGRQLGGFEPESAVIIETGAGRGTGRVGRHDPARQNPAERVQGREEEGRHARSVVRDWVNVRTRPVEVGRTRAPRTAASQCSESLLLQVPPHVVVDASADQVFVVVEPPPAGRAEGELVAHHREDHVFDQVQVQP